MTIPKSEDPNFDIEGINNFTITVRDDEEPLINDFIKGRIWNDRNKDGQIDSNEQGLSNVQVFIDENNKIFDQGEDSIVTDAQGFMNLLTLTFLHILLV